MRDIKFRIWSTINKPQMIYLPTSGEYMGNDLIKTDTWNVMQYTGLKDKNGTEIYEGDIVEFTVFDCNDNDIQFKGVIMWSECSWMIWRSPEVEFYGNDGGFDFYWVVQQDDEFEVVGNIYENSELINPQETK